MNRLLRASMAPLLPLVVGASLAACTRDPKPEPKLPSTPVASAAPQASQRPLQPAMPRKDTATPTSGSIQIEDRILRACGDIPDARFEFDSALLDDKVQASLTALARCFVSGPLAGKSLKLVGHADPRGTTSYNLGLGQRRAGTVATFIVSKGLAESKIATSSVGSEEAVGTDEEGWAKNRKVDVFLAE